MDAQTSGVGYTSATTRRGDHEVHKGHVVAMEKNIACVLCQLAATGFGVESSSTPTLVVAN
jgi:hypothetical protein